MRDHLVMVVKYRRRVIDETVSVRLRAIWENIALGYGIAIEKWNHDGNHVHVLSPTAPHAVALDVLGLDYKSDGLYAGSDGNVADMPRNTTALLRNVCQGQNAGCRRNGRVRRTVRM